MKEQVKKLSADVVRRDEVRERLNNHSTTGSIEGG